ncbi:phosphoglycolate phosphatase [Maritimibacter sp. DP4N28-5]|uniref:Phosphoglycolate phosphatase n=1 Tax=Maritimibacter dapengensis TaxID=2836868 RepID=A0ABS6T151_9RHOB|nr:phosphoglycolate phosphatase [Maritimibacter dapengensis]
MVFDLDGTLIHSAPDIRCGVNEVMAMRGLPFFPMDEVIAMIGNGLPALCERVRVARGLAESEKERLFAEISIAYSAVNGIESEVYPGVADALNRLAARGHALGVCTNKPRGPALDVLTRFDLAEQMSVIVGGDDLSVKKPDPAPLAAAFDSLGGRGIFVGDSEIDALTATNLGVPFILFTEGYRKSPAEALKKAAAFSAFDDLPRLIETQCFG